MCPEIRLRKLGETQGVFDITRISVKKGDLLLVYPACSVKIRNEDAQPLLGVFDRLDEDIMYLRERALLLQLPLVVGGSEVIQPKNAGTLPRYKTDRISQLYVGPEEIANHLAEHTNGLELYADWIRLMSPPYDRRRGRT